MTKQSRLASLSESIVNVLVGFGLSLALQATVLPALGVPMPFSINLIFAVIMTAVSIARSFGLRRLFEALHIRRPLSPAMHAVIAERFRQIEVEGWSAEHDDAEHAAGELAAAGAAYAVRCTTPEGRVPASPPTWWPWSQDWWKPTAFRRDLIKAAALIIAEIDKHDRSRSRVKTRELQPTPAAWPPDSERVHLRTAAEIEEERVAAKGFLAHGKTAHEQGGSSC
jgi:hypothetical protein